MCASSQGGYAYGAPWGTPTEITWPSLVTTDAEPLCRADLLSCSVVCSDSLWRIWRSGSFGRGARPLSNAVSSQRLDHEKSTPVAQLYSIERSPGACTIHKRHSATLCSETNRWKIYLTREITASVGVCVAFHPLLVMHLSLLSLPVLCVAGPGLHRLFQLRPTSSPPSHPRAVCRRAVPACTP